MEQAHIADALVFELSKVQRVDIRARMVSHLLNIDKGLADKVSGGLRLRDTTKATVAAMPTRQDLKPSPALSILRNGPKSFAGRKVGVLVTDGADATLLKALADSVTAEGATLKLVAPEVGGIKASDGTWHDADEKLDGAPSVLFDAVVILSADAALSKLVAQPAARDFVADALAHKKFIGYSKSGMPLLLKVRGGDAADAGQILLETAGHCQKFASQCRALRFWGRS